MFLVEIPIQIIYLAIYIMDVDVGSCELEKKRCRAIYARSKESSNARRRELYAEAWELRSVRRQKLYIQRTKTTVGEGSSHAGAAC